MSNGDKNSRLAEKMTALRHLNEGKAKETRLNWRKRIYEIIEVGRGEDKISRIVFNSHQ